MKQNKLRELLNKNMPTVGTRIWSTAPFFTEIVGITGNYDYIEFVAEYAPFDQKDLEVLAITSELHNMGSMIKIDFQNRGYVAQKAVASGFQAVLFTDCRTADEAQDCVRMLTPETEPDRGGYGMPIRRFIGCQPRVSQTAHAQRLRDVVKVFMMEKKEAIDNIEEICAVPGVDMVQFGPSDYCFSRGWNRTEHTDEFKEAERAMIKAALKHGVHPRCEIQSIDAAKYYIDMGVKHFCIGDQFAKLFEIYEKEGGAMRNLADSLK